MKGKLLLLLAVAAVGVLGLGPVIAWSAIDSSGSGPAVWSHGAATMGQMHGGVDMSAMHRGLDEGDVDRMAQACEKAMEDGDTMDGAGNHMGGAGDDVSGPMGGMMDGDEAGMMGGMMGGGTR